MGKELRLLVVDDEEIVRHTVSGFLTNLGHRVDCAVDGQEGLGLLQSNEYDLALVDVRMPHIGGIAFLERVQSDYPEMAVILVSGHGTMDTVIEALRLGAADYLTKPIKLRELEAAIQKATRVHALQVRERHLRETIAGIQKTGAGGSECGFVGVSPAARQARRAIRRAAEAGCDTVLLEGETGVGKEVLARCLHQHGLPEDAPFIAVNCPALPESLAESELFGHVKGAFTGADKDHAGCFELADGGTLFLDEIGELPIAMQAKLLRVLESRALRRVGGEKEIPVRVRVVAATNRNLPEAVKQGQFRQDLFYRLNVFRVAIAPLRQRPEDILPLAEHFLESYCSERGIEPPPIAGDAARALAEYRFPGNARELRNILERAAILSGGHPIQPEHLAMRNPAPTLATQVATHEDPEAAEILKALEETRWNRRRAAELLDMPYSTLRYKIARLGLN